jgi:NAD(P)-dependent dehydrogenase (short-subunit alcohol dehydrogenase family)
MTNRPTTLITGCASGIGQAIAELFAARGHHVVAAMRDPSKGQHLAEHGCEVVELDVTDPEALGRAIRGAGPLDVLINNAGVGYYGAVETMPDDVLRETFEVNLFAPVAAIRAALPAMRARRSGTIVNISSVMGQVPVPVGSAYAASKAGLEAVSEALALEVYPFGVRVVIIQPGFFRTSIAANGRPRSRLRADSPYAALEEKMADRNQAGVGGGQDPMLAAEQIWDAVHTESVQLRVPVGATAAGILSARRAATDDQWLARMRIAYELGTPASDRRRDA